MPIVFSRTTDFIRSFAVAAFGLWLVAAAPAGAQDAQRMDQVVRAQSEADAFSGSVLVAKDGQVLLDRGYGFANREWRAPNDGDTKFRLGSLTKQFTAVAVLMLAEQGKVDLDAPIKTWLPDAPAAWDSVTPRRLLSHTAVKRPARIDEILAAVLFLADPDNTYMTGHTLNVDGGNVMS